jgi:hypothetical protein
METCLPRPRSRSDRWAISLINRLPIILYTPLRLEGIVGHREGDFDFCHYLSQIVAIATNVLICYRIQNPEAPSIVYLQVM